MSSIFNTTLRFNLDDPEDRMALAYLQGRDRKRYKSYSSAVVAAVNDYFARQERLTVDPFLETRERQEAFLQEVKNTIRDAVQTSGASLGGLAALLQSIQSAPPQEQVMSDEAYDMAMDFISGL